MGENILNLISAEDFNNQMNTMVAIQAAMARQMGVKDQIEIPALQDWQFIQKVVKLGLAPKLWKVGDTITAQHAKYGKIDFDIIGFDVEEPVDENVKYTMTIQTHAPVISLVFDQPEPTNPDANRQKYGSNNWQYSNVRQWLNSELGAGYWFTPQTEYDVKPGYASTEDGFLKGMGQDFKQSIVEVKKTTALNTVTDNGGSIITHDKGFLLSNTEIYAGLNGGIAEGVAYPYYSETSDLSSPGTGNDKNRIKYNAGGSAQHWWTRSPFTGYSHYVYNVLTTGGVSSYYASSSNGVAPAFVIG